MTSHSSILAWEIQWTQEPGGLQSMGSQTEHTRMYAPGEKTRNPGSLAVAAALATRCRHWSQIVFQCLLLLLLLLSRISRVPLCVTP